ncbi:MAG: hypothetical protein IPJ34_23275 [Myxococcales bacterium]|nr:hypothetical protein [Myxococcales bacterium]
MLAPRGNGKPAGADAVVAGGDRHPADRHLFVATDDSLVLLRETAEIVQPRPLGKVECTVEEKGWTC